MEASYRRSQVHTMNGTSPLATESLTWRVIGSAVWPPWPTIAGASRPVVWPGTATPSRPMTAARPLSTRQLTVRGALTRVFGRLEDLGWQLDRCRGAADEGSAGGRRGLRRRLLRAQAPAGPGHPGRRRHHERLAGGQRVGQKLTVRSLFVL